ncbi:Alpha/Beta hydrolase protein [Tribonema minus]|uniref:Alpha/Beta hydrolase protein n=1 Tax=Tribonema minus TaxID=303371 RepID=A0A835Z8A5_9STRA|nr:Alpha/Beta hydrolase protein [Tribonema minus]
MASPACCKAGPPISSDYEPKGTIATIGDQEVYFSGSGPRAICIVYDIFGLSPQAKQVCDKLADAGFSVAMPDFARGQPWLLENFPPKDQGEFMAWVGKHDFDAVIRPDMERVQAHMRETMGAKVFGAIGFCWGGSIATKAACAQGLVAAGAAVHYAFITPELVEGVCVPLCLLPSGDDPDTAPLKEVLDKKPFGAACVYHRFEDMHHGFCAARGDWSQPLIAQRASEAVAMLSDFMDKNLKA